MKIPELPSHWLATPAKTAENLPTVHRFALPLEDAARIHALANMFGQSEQVVLQDLLKSAFDMLATLEANPPSLSAKPASKKTA